MPGLHAAVMYLAVLPQLLVGFAQMPSPKQVWIDQPRFRGWGCSECGWIFSPVGPPTGASFDEMMNNFESRRDQEFASHVCAEHPRNVTPS
jgi:hypothetical protein